HRRRAEHSGSTATKWTADPVSEHGAAGGGRRDRERADALAQPGHRHLSDARLPGDSRGAAARDARDTHPLRAGSHAAALLDCPGAVAVARRPGGWILRALAGLRRAGLRRRIGQRALHAGLSARAGPTPPNSGASGLCTGRAGGGLARAPASGWWADGGGL